MNYKIIIYKLIIFKVKQSNNKEIRKKYFQKIKTIDNINFEDLTNKMLEYKKIYKDSCYIFSTIKSGLNDWYIENLNNKSYKYYVDYVGGVYND